MPEFLADQILRTIGEVDGLYHRLVIVAAPSGGGKTAALQEVAERTGYPRININLGLSRRLLGLTERQRSIQIPQLLSEILREMPGEAVLLAWIPTLGNAVNTRGPTWPDNRPCGAGLS